MSKPIISVENLSKAYRIGSKEQAPDTLVGAMTAAVKSPLRNFNRLRRLDTFGSDTAEEDTLWALKDVSFDVQEGEVVGIIGRNGAGKSTLLKILSRITEPTSGRVVIRGRVSSLLEVGTGFHPELTGRDNIYMNGTILGMTKREIDRKFDEIVDFSGVEKFLDTPVKRYSSGMQVRLAFAVAAHLEPEVLIIDEVLAVGDAEFQKKCLGKMQDVASHGRTVLFVSHNMNAVQQLCNRSVLLMQGDVHRDSDTDSVIIEYLKKFAPEANDRLRFEQPVNPLVDSSLSLAELITKDGTPAQRFLFGQPFGIKMNWYNQKEIQGISFAVRFIDQRGGLATAANTLQLENQQLSSKGLHNLICWVNQNDFAPGVYSIRLSATVRPNNYVSAYENCLTLIIEDLPWQKSRPYTIKGSPAFVVYPSWEYFTPATHHNYTKQDI